MKLCITILLSLFLAGIVSSVYGEDELSQKKWEQLTKKLDYSQKEKAQKPAKKEEAPSQRTSDYHYSGGGSSFGNVGSLFMIIALVLLILLVVYMLVNAKSNPSLNAINKEIQEKIENIEEHIHDVDLNDLFKKYVTNREFDLALRISFLMIIKDLSERHLIKWEKQKTNWEYHGELNGYDLKTGFGSMIKNFERIWYGEKAINEPEFVNINDEFDRFKTQLGVDAKE